MVPSNEKNDVSDKKRSSNNRIIINFSVAGTNYYYYHRYSITAHFRRGIGIELFKHEYGRARLATNVPRPLLSWQRITIIIWWSLFGFSFVRKFVDPAVRARPCLLLTATTVSTATSRRYYTNACGALNSLRSPVRRPQHGLTRVFKQGLLESRRRRILIIII